MATSLIVTPNNVQHRVKDNSWYVLHVMPDSRDEYAILDPVSYKRDDGSMRYKAKIPVLLSITSTEENEVFMDARDVFRCYKIPYSRDIKSLDVEITYTFSCNRESVDTVRFSCYEVLIADQEKYEDF